MAADKNTTVVTAWLKENNAEDFIDAFYEDGYLTIESVNDKAIDTILKEKKPGLVNALKNSLAELKKEKEEAQAEKKKEKEEAKKPMSLPELPEGTVLDLSAPKIPSPEKDITFSVPKALSVDKTEKAIISPNNIEPKDWMIIARGANLLYAYDMDKDEAKYAKTPILDWKVPDRDDFVRSEISHAKVTSTLAYSDVSASYVASGFDTETATAAYTFCAASVARNYKEKKARSAETKTLIQIGMWKYPRAQIYLDKCTVTSERFIKAIKTALEAKNKFGELENVFKEYGHVIPSSVLLGGLLSYKETRTNVSSTDEANKQWEVKAKVEGKVQKASASIGGSLGKATDKKTGDANLDEFTSFTNQGGDSLLCSNPAESLPLS